MRKLNKLIRNENGSITMFVTLSVLFLMFVLVGIYANYANKLKAQEEQIGKIQNNYGQYASNEGMDKLYIKRTQKEEDNEGDTEGDEEDEDVVTLLPSEYQQVEYIESTGTQYINTGVCPNGIYKYKWIGTLSQDNALWGSYGQVESNSGTLYMGKIYCFGESTIKLPSNIFNTISEGEVTMNINTLKTSVKISDYEYELEVQGGGYPPQEIYLFAQARPSKSASDFSKYRLNKFQMIINDILIRNFIPCYSTITVTDINGKQCPAGTIGLYDTVEGEFYTNQGTGTFSYE